MQFGFVHDGSPGVIVDPPASSPLLAARAAVAVDVKDSCRVAAEDRVVALQPAKRGLRADAPSPSERCRAPPRLERSSVIGHAHFNGSVETAQADTAKPAKFFARRGGKIPSRHNRVV